MKRISRRDVLKTTVAGGIVCGVGTSLWENHASASDPNSEVRLAILGLGGIDIPGQRWRAGPTAHRCTPGCARGKSRFAL